MQSLGKEEGLKKLRIHKFKKPEESTQSVVYQNTRRKRSTKEEESIQNISGNEPISSSFPNIFKKKEKKKLVDWTPEEDKMLFMKYASQGSKWVEIASIFPTKNDNDIKNRFYACIRRITKRINQYQHKIKSSHKKMVGFTSLLTILEVGKFNEENLDGRFIEIKKNIQEILEVGGLIIDLACRPQSQINDQMIQPFFSKLTNLKYSLKFINMKRVKKSAVKGSEVQNYGAQRGFKFENQPDNQQNQIFETPQEKESNTGIEDHWLAVDLQEQGKPIKIEKSLIQCFSEILDQSLIQNQKRNQLSFLL